MIATATVKVNKYAGTCAGCGARVEPGEGRRTYTGNRWAVLHLDGACPERTASQPAAVRSNRFAGPCRACGGHVEADEGRVEKTGSGWQVSHLDGTCPPPEQVAPVGIYRHDGQIYLVRESRGQKDLYPVEDRRRYAEVLVERSSGDRMTEGGDAVRYDWDRVPGMVYRLTGAERVAIDDEQVTAMMIATGQCMICHHAVWAESTMRKGRETGQLIGPVCRKYFGPAA
jgi:hypothetical protein